MNEQETWVQVGKSIYEVSNYGKVRNFVTGKELTPYKTRNGYMTVGLWSMTSNHSRNYRVHRLVAEAFISNPEGLPEVNHINGDKSDNRVSNLEWVSSRDNVRWNIIRAARERGYEVEFKDK